MLEKINLKKTYLKKSNQTSGNEFLLTLRRSDNGAYVSFHYHDNYLNKVNKEYAILTLLNDADDYEANKKIKDFCREFGYLNDYEYPTEQGIKAFNGCKRQYERRAKLLSYEEWLELKEELDELGIA